MGTRYVPIGGPQQHRRDEGFLGFLGKLEWIRDAELENMVPFDTEKLRTPHVVYIFTQGAELALGLHGIAALAFVSFIALGFILPLMEFLTVMTELYLIAIKVGLPIWLIHKFVTFQRGLATEMIKHYIIGYSSVSILVDFLGAGFGLIAFVLSTVIYGVGLDVYDEYIYPFISAFINLKLIIFLFINLIVDPIPIVYFYFFRKKRKEKFPRWIPLDTIPEDKN